MNERLTGSTEGSTRERLLDVAEELFAKRGVAQASLRDITTQAEANLAAVSYHFGSKEGLLQAIVKRAAAPLHRERMRLLELAVSAAGEHAPTPRALLRAFIEPVFQLRDRHPHFPELLARVFAENLMPVIGELFRENFVNGFDRFAAALGSSLPHVAPEEIRWRLLFSVGVFHFMCKGEDPVQMLFGRKADLDELLDRILSFCEAGIVGLQEPEGGCA